MTPLPSEAFDGETQLNTPRPIDICQTHTPEGWQDHTGYHDNGDGTASCDHCPWGFRIPGAMRIIDGRIFDLKRTVSS